MKMERSIYNFLAGSTIRGITEQIPNWIYYPRLGILNFWLGIFDTFWDWGYLSQVSQSQRSNPQSSMGKKIPNWKFRISNWVSSIEFSWGHNSVACRRTQTPGAVIVKNTSCEGCVFKASLYVVCERCNKRPHIVITKQVCKGHVNTIQYVPQCPLYCFIDRTMLQC